MGLNRHKYVKEVEDKLGIETTYYFTIDRVKTYLCRDGSMDPLEHDAVTAIMNEEKSLKELAKKIKEWKRDMRADYLEHESTEKAITITFESRDLTIYAVVNGRTSEKKDVNIVGEEREQFIKTISKKR